MKILLSIMLIFNFSIFSADPTHKDAFNTVRRTFSTETEAGELAALNQSARGRGALHMAPEMLERYAYLLDRNTKLSLMYTINGNSCSLELETQKNKPHLAKMKIQEGLALALVIANSFQSPQQRRTGNLVTCKIQTGLEKKTVGVYQFRLTSNHLENAQSISRNPNYTFYS